jgi:hypothetical protein
LLDAAGSALVVAFTGLLLALKQLELVLAASRLQKATCVQLSSFAVPKRVKYVYQYVKAHGPQGQRVVIISCPDDRNVSASGSEQQTLVTASCNRLTKRDDQRWNGKV